MTPEAVLSIAIEKIIGAAFRGLISSVLSSSSGRTDSEVILEVLRQVQQQGNLIGSLGDRVSAVEVEVRRLSRTQNTAAATTFCLKCGGLPGSVEPRCPRSQRSGQHSWREGSTLCFCFKCGGRPGAVEVRCPASSRTGDHSWSDGVNAFFCYKCGGVPGAVAARCPRSSRSGDHSWTKGATSSFCVRCGGFPGEVAGKCPSSQRSGDHSWHDTSSK